MNQVRLLLFITHLPIFGSIFGALVLFHGIGMRSNQTIIAAYYIFIISSIGAGIAFFTGEGAEESVGKLQGVVETTIKQHKDSALFTLISLIGLGLASIFGFFTDWSNFTCARTTAFVILILSVISFGLVARTGYLGVQIRHSEINPVWPTRSKF